MDEGSVRGISRNTRKKMGAVMSGNLADFSGNIPQNYDSGMGPIIFAGYAADIAQRIASHAPSSVLETASGTGIVTRALRDALPASTQLTATDLNVDMLEIARAKFRSNEQVAFQPADAYGATISRCVIRRSHMPVRRDVLP